MINDCPAAWSHGLLWVLKSPDAAELSESFYPQKHLYNFSSETLNSKSECQELVLSKLHFLFFCDPPGQDCCRDFSYWQFNSQECFLACTVESGRKDILSLFIQTWRNFFWTATISSESFNFWNRGTVERSLRRAFMKKLNSFIAQVDKKNQKLDKC